MARRLKQIAEFINTAYPLLIASIEEGHCNTDRYPKGVAYRIPGKGRKGNRIIVRWRHLDPLDRSSKVLDHNSAQTYRTNDEVERWLEHEAPKLVMPARPPV